MVKIDIILKLILFDQKFNLERHIPIRCIFLNEKLNLFFNIPLMIAVKALNTNNNCDRKIEFEYLA